MAETIQKEIINKDTTIGDAIQAFPKASEIFLEYGLHCVGCHVNPYESIEQGSRGHGMSDELIQKMVSDVNKAATQALDQFKESKPAEETEASNKPTEESKPAETDKPVELDVSNMKGIFVTDSAAKKLKELVAEKGESYGVRVGVLAGGCSGHSYDMGIEEKAAENDIVIDTKGVKVFISPDSLKLLDGTELDYVETIQQSGFKFNNPQAESTCGCGKSFG